jgi:hypothetical protein
MKPAGVSERIQFADANTDKYSSRGGLWGIIAECHREGWLAACSATGGREQDSGMGILTGHAYSIIDARELLVKGQPEYLLQIRNPWGQKEWTGIPHALLLSVALSLPPPSPEIPSGHPDIPSLFRPIFGSDLICPLFLLQTSLVLLPPLILTQVVGVTTQRNGPKKLPLNLDTREMPTTV